MIYHALVLALLGHLCKVIRFYLPHIPSPVLVFLSLDFTRHDCLCSLLYYRAPTFAYFALRLLFYVIKFVLSHYLLTRQNLLCIV